MAIAGESTSEFHACSWSAFSSSTGLVSPNKSSTDLTVLNIKRFNRFICNTNPAIPGRWIAPLLVLRTGASSVRGPSRVQLRVGEISPVARYNHKVTALVFANGEIMSQGFESSSNC